MLAPALSLRPRCPACLRALRACICRWIVPTAHEAEVLILQHPDEVYAAKGTARLLHLSLVRSRIEIGESFPEAALRAWLHGPQRPLLLYPDTPHILPPPPPLALPAAPSALRLVVLDATWRKSLKMLFANPLLQALPRVALHHPPPSAYAIRKAHRPGQLATLEATCHALSQLEDAPGRYEPLLHAFEGFVAQQRAFFRRDP